MNKRQLLFLPLLLIGVTSFLCPPTGPVLPAPDIPENFLSEELSNVLSNLVENSLEDGWDRNTTSFSIMATSPSHSFFSYHHTAQVRDETGANEISDDTVYMIASVTKVFTVLATWLEERLDLDDPIGKYVEGFDIPGWENVTLRLLTSQMAAVSRQGYLFDLARGPESELLQALGFPPLPPSEIPTCEFGASGMKCPREEFVKSIVDIGFTGEVGGRVAYSNVAYMLLGLALENITGKSFEDVLQEAILAPLGLENTSISPPPKEQVILPDVETWYGLDMEYFSPTGGLYSTPNDLSKFLRSILNDELVSSAKTNEWLKPTGFTSSLDNLVGAPWEIYRPTGLTDSSRPIDHYTKSGDVPGYASYIVLVPEYGLGVTIHAAGLYATGLASLVLDTVQAALVPALENLARVQARSLYAGDYVENNGNSSTAVSLVIDDGPGLKFSRWTDGDVDMLKNLAVVFLGLPLEKAVPVDARLYPIGLKNRWRLVVSQPEDFPEVPKSPVKGDICATWSSVDGIYYGGVPLDRVDFHIGDDGTVEGLDLSVFRTKLMKVKKCETTGVMRILVGQRF